MPQPNGDNLSLYTIELNLHYLIKNISVLVERLISLCHSLTYYTL